MVSGQTNLRQKKISKKLMVQAVARMAVRKISNFFEINVQRYMRTGWCKQQRNCCWSHSSIKIVGVDWHIFPLKNIIDLLPANKEVQRHKKLTFNVFPPYPFTVQVNLVPDSRATRTVRSTINSSPEPWQTNSLNKPVGDMVRSLAAESVDFLFKKAREENIDTPCRGTLC